MEFWTLFIHHIWDFTYEEAMGTAYNQVDLLFLNDEYCHFRKTFWDVKFFCHEESNCKIGDILANSEANAFSLIA